MSGSTGQRWFARATAALSGRGQPQAPVTAPGVDVASTDRPPSSGSRAKDISKVYKDALLTPSQKGSIHDHPSGRPIQWHSGAAYTARGRLIRHSRRTGGMRGDFLHSIDQDLITVGTPSAKLEGDWYYGGPWFAQFGHFLVETLPTLWDLRDGERAVFHGLPRATLEPYRLDLLALAGLEAAPVFVAGLTQVQRLRVASRPVVLNTSISPAAAALWGRMGSDVLAGPAGTQRTWFSRSKFESASEGTGRVVGMSDFDEHLASMGFDVVYPETMSMAEQIRVVRESGIVAGIEGSALHLSAFAVPGTHVLMLGTQKRPSGNHFQRLIDKAVGNRLSIVEHADDESMLASISSRIENPARA